MSDQPLQRMENAPPATTPESETSATLAVIARAATDKTVDMDKMERLLAMQERIMAKQAENAFNAAMKKAQEQMPRIKRDARNSQTNSNYARLESLNKAIVPVYTEHGFSLSYGSTDCPIPEHRRITCRVSHAAGHSRDYCLDLPLDMVGMKGAANKTAVHAFGSTISYARRYLALMIFNISTTDDDDGNAAGGSGAESLTELKAKLWALLKPVRGPENNWTMARRWLVDECCLDPDVPIANLDAEGFKAVIAAAKKKLEGNK